MVLACLLRYHCPMTAAPHRRPGRRHAADGFTLIEMMIVVAVGIVLAAVAIPYIEVHLSNVHAREPFRHHSYFSDKAVGTIVGLGSSGYELALQFALRQIKTGKL